MAVERHEVIPLDEVLAALPDGPVSLSGGEFDLDDDEYAAMVRRMLADEIGEGTGANFVASRTFHGEVADWSRPAALAWYRRLLRRDSGAYWTFVIHTGARTFLGASPERHLRLDDGRLTMNPISGTYRYPATGPELTGLLSFLADAKETNELYMVLDEELKMMSRVCDRGARVLGPYLRPLANLAHTEYLIEGRSSRDVREMVRETMFAPTVTGGPLESACRAIARHEPSGRGYYAGVAALIGRDAAGEQSLDSAILIRTADVDARGHVRIGAGATLVRDSDPAEEAAETTAKARALLDTLQPVRPGSAASSRVDPEAPELRTALAERNGQLAEFWFEDPRTRHRHRPALAGRRVLIVDAEDMFTGMVRNLLVALGLEVTLVRFDEPYRLDGYDLVVVGPGPGDPGDPDDPRIAHVRALVRGLLAGHTRFLAVCLGHQVLCDVLGLRLRRRPKPNQGLQLKVPLFGHRELVGYYNTFAACSPVDRIPCRDRGGEVEVFRGEADDEVHGLRGPGFASVQGHLESVLSKNGVDILGDVLTDLWR
jgi:phenazine biosynthesis protein phzE